MYLPLLKGRDTLTVIKDINNRSLLNSEKDFKKSKKKTKYTKLDV